VSEQPKSSLFNDGFDNTLLIEQYKMYIESTDRFSGYRNQANTFFLTLNTTLIGLITAILQFSTQDSRFAWILLVSITGMLLSVTWFALVYSYRNLNTARFKVVHELEERLPARIYAREWDFIKSSKRYITQSRVEQVVPVVFFVVYALLGVIVR
jgi:hypothetical protein